MSVDQSLPAPENEPVLDGHIEDLGPGKNVLVRDRRIGENSSTEEPLEVFDGYPTDSRKQQGIDPYNSGEFDRSKYWDLRFRD